MTADLTVLSLGAGVQSSALLLLACQGELHADRAIFADTGDEPESVYRWLETLEAHAARAGLPVDRVSAGRLSDDQLDPDKDRSLLPVFLRTGSAGGGTSTRRCTYDYKIAPIRRRIRELLGQPTGTPPAGAVDMLIGISTDEVQRAKTSKVAFIVNRYPLLDRGWRRSDAVAYVESFGMGTPPRSACVYCPFHSDAEWRRMRDDEPDSWEEAVAFDRRLREVNRERRRRAEETGGNFGLRGDPYVHRSLRPLDAVDLSTPEDRGQLSMFTEECEGMCGV